MEPALLLQAKGGFFYLDPDHFGDKELYAKLNIADPDAPASGDAAATGESLPQEFAAAAAQSGTTTKLEQRSSR